MKNIITLLIIIAGFISCNLEQIIEIDLGKHESQLIVNCFPQGNEDTVFIHVSKSIGINEDADTLPLPDTNVKLYKDGILLGETTNYKKIRRFNDTYYQYPGYEENPAQYIYPIPLNEPLTGGSSEYKIEVHADNYNEASATSSMYSSINVTKAEYISTVNEDVTCTIEFEDLSTDKDYYIISGTENRYYYDGTDTIWYVDKLYLESKDPAVLPEDDYISYSYLYIDDDTFNGKTKSLTFNFYSYNTADTKKWDFKISAITEDYYNFLISFDKNVDSYDDFESFLFAPEPVIVKSNVKNGFGFFGMSNFSKISINP